MKFRLAMGLLAVAPVAMAQDFRPPQPFVSPCPAPNLLDVPVGGTLPTPSANCQGVDVSAWPMAPVAGVSATVPQDGTGQAKAMLQAPVAGEPVAVRVPEQVPTQYSDPQLLRLGELDGRMGQPINKLHAGNLSYLQGYTKGQALRVQRPLGGMR